MRYAYPAIFSLDKTDENYPNGVYLVTFPDLEDCFTDGETLAEACEMAQDVLNLFLVTLEDQGKPLPSPTYIKNVKTTSPDDIVTLVPADTLEYRKQISKKAVKKTLTIPQWLDTAAQRANINFSNVLQNALIKELGIEA